MGVALTRNAEEYEILHILSTWLRMWNTVPKHGSFRVRKKLLSVQRLVCWCKHKHKSNTNTGP